MMELITGKRIPLTEESFVDTSSARFYDEHARRFMAPIYRRLAAKATEYRLTGKRVLDIGTGSGLLAIELARVSQEWQITGTDISEEMLKLARENATRVNLAERIDFQQAQAAALPFPDGYFSLVVCNASLHLWADPLKVFKEIARVTSSGGYCLIWDNLRLAMFHPFLRFIGWVMGMKASQRRLWLNAVRSSYTIGEVKAVLTDSAFKDAHVAFIPGIFYLSIEWKKP